MHKAPTDRLLFLSDFHFWQIVRNPLHLTNKRFLGNFNVWYRRRHEFHMGRAEGYADYLAALGIDTVLLGGDFTSTATAQEFELGRAFVRGLVRRGLQVHVLAGNHDVYTFESVRRKRFEEFFADWVPADGLPALATLPGGTPLILAPTVCPNLLSSAGVITRTQGDRIRELIDAQPPGPVIVAGHYPALHQTHAYLSTPARRLRNADHLLRALRATDRPVLYLAGHVHRFSLVRDAEKPTLWHCTTAAFFLKRRHELQEGGFVEIEAGPDGFGIVEHHCAAGLWRAEARPLP